MSVIAYLDEQEETIGGEKFTAIVGFVLPVNQLDELRHSFYPALNSLLNSTKHGGSGQNNFINMMAPGLHGSDFFPDRTDDFKFEVLGMLFSALSAVDAQFIRIGYFHSSLSGFGSESLKHQAIQNGLTSTLFALSSLEDTFQIVFEFDKEFLRREIRSKSDTMLGYYSLGENNTELAYRRFIGHFFAPKADFGCQVADVVGYAALKKLTASTAFGKRFGEYYNGVSDRYLLNEIVWCNDQSKSLSFPQKYDQPLRRWFKITPRD